MANTGKRAACTGVRGWLAGALLAQQVFRHKTRKVSFQLVFWLIVMLHQVFWIDRLFLGANLLALF
jgi:uncharacterized membrane protein YsdA (DUF1294 family)